MAETFDNTRDQPEQPTPALLGPELYVTAEAVVIRNGLVLEDEPIQPIQLAPSSED